MFRGHHVSDIRETLAQRGEIQCAEKTICVTANTTFERNTTRFFTEKNDMSAGYAPMGAWFVVLHSFQASGRASFECMRMDQSRPFHALEQSGGEHGA